MSKVRCYDPKYLKATKKLPGNNCKHFDRDANLCTIKHTGGGKRPQTFPSKPRKCELYAEKEE